MHWVNWVYVMKGGICSLVVVMVGLERISDLLIFTHAWQVQSEIPDIESHWDLRRARVVEVRFRDAFARKTWLCKRTSDGVTLAEDPTCLKKDKLDSAQREGQDTGPAVCQSRGNRLNKIPWTWYQGQLKAQAGFLVSRSLTLSFAPKWAESSQTQTVRPENISWYKCRKMKMINAVCCEPT